jgi:hypothetical protein
MNNYYRTILNVQAVAPFIPTHIAGCQLWLDAADATTISIGTGVSQWNNKGVLGGNFNQGTGGAQPAYITAGLNGKNILRFDGTKQLIGSLSAASYNYFHQDVRTDFYVIKIGTSSDPKTLYTILSNGTLTALHGSGVAYDDRSIFNRNNSIYHLNSSNNASVYNTSNVNNDAFIPNTWGKFHVLADPKNSTAANRSEIVVGSTSYKNNTATLAASTTNATHVLRIGGNPDFTGFLLVGDLAEIISYNKLLSSGEITTVNNYLSTKWAI